MRLNLLVALSVSVSLSAASASQARQLPISKGRAKATQVLDHEVREHRAASYELGPCWHHADHVVMCHTELADCDFFGDGELYDVTVSLTVNLRRSGRLAVSI